MSRNQEGVHAAVRAETGTALDYLSDWHALFTADGVAAGDWNSRMIAWVNQTLGTSYTSLNDAMNAFAIDQGFERWQDMNTLVLAVSGAMELLDGETQGLALDFTDSFYQADTGFYGSMAVIDTTTPANDWDSSPTTTSTSKLTYTSPSVKMTMGPSGTLRYQAHNLLTYSEDLTNAAWVVSGSPIRTATTIEDDNAGAFEAVTQTVTSVAGATYAATWRVTKDAVPSATRFVVFRCVSTSTFDIALDTSTGAFVNVATRLFTTAAVVDGGTYWEVTGTFTAGTTTIAVTIFPAVGSKADVTTVVGGDYVAATLGSVGSSGVHLRRTPSDSTYLKTTTASRFGLPLEWSSAGVLQGLRVEEARTNSFTYSNTFSNAAWTKSAVSVTQNATGPDGLTSAWTMTDSVATASFRVSQVPTTTAASWTHSIYAKAGTNSWLRILVDGTSTGSIAAFFNVSTGAVGTVGAGLTANIESVGSGWYRCSVVATMTAAANRIYYQQCTADNQTTYTGAGTGTLLLYQADAQAGAFITSPIETFASTVTRAADNINLATTAFPFSLTGGTWSVKALPNRTATNTCIMGSPSSNYEIREGNPDTFSALAGADLFINNRALGSGNFSDVKINMAYDASNISASGNGSAIGATDTGTIIASVATIYFGSRTGNAIFCNGYIEKVLFVPRKVSDGDLPTFGVT